MPSTQLSSGSIVHNSDEGAAQSKIVLGTDQITLEGTSSGTCELLNLKESSSTSSAMPRQYFDDRIHLSYTASNTGVAWTSSYSSGTSAGTELSNSGAPSDIEGAALYTSTNVLLGVIDQIISVVEVNGEEFITGFTLDRDLPVAISAGDSIYVVHTRFQIFKDLDFMRGSDSSLGIGTSMTNESYSPLSAGYGNIGLGANALQSVTTGYNNISIGTSVASRLTTGHSNIGLGTNALQLVTTGYNNIGLGIDALTSVTTGYNNIGLGINALTSVTTGRENTSVGDEALMELSIGMSSTAVGAGALGNKRNHTELYLQESVSSTGDQSIAVTTNTVLKEGMKLYGSDAQVWGTITEVTLNGSSEVTHVRCNWEATPSSQAEIYVADNSSTAVGKQALNNETLGGYNTSVGFHALSLLVLGRYCTAVGYQAGDQVTSGDNNTLVGYMAGETITTGDSHTVVGAQAVTSGAATTHEIVIGQDAQGLGSHQAVLGATSQEACTIYGNLRLPSANELDQGENVLSTTHTHYFSTSSSEITATLPAGAAGQVVVLAMRSHGGGNFKITVTNAIWGGNSSVTFTGTGQACTLQYITYSDSSSHWYCTGNNGATFS